LFTTCCAVAAASRIEASACLSGESRTLHSTTRCHTAECSPCIALAQCALGCKPQMRGRLLQPGCNQDHSCVPHRACAPPQRNKARVKAKAQPGMTGAIAAGVGLAEPASPIRIEWRFIKLYPAPKRGRKPRSAARLSNGRTCSGLAHPPWPRAPPGRPGPWPGRPGLCLSPQMRLGCAPWYLGYSGCSISDRG
jgi:hypothetical protein